MFSPFRYRAQLKSASTSRERHHATYLAVGRSDGTTDTQARTRWARWRFTQEFVMHRCIFVAPTALAASAAEPPYHLEHQSK
jgi:hypothetical protein